MQLDSLVLVYTYILFQDNAHDLKTEVIYVIFLELGRRFLYAAVIFKRHLQEAEDILSEMKEGIMYCILVALLKKGSNC